MGTKYDITISGYASKKFTLIAENKEDAIAQALHIYQNTSVIKMTDNDMDDIYITASKPGSLETEMKSYTRIGSGYVDTDKWLESLSQS